MEILFLCTSNSAKSQIAEGLARRVLGEKAHVQSAGSLPTEIHPLAVRVLEEEGVETDGLYAKPLDTVQTDHLDLVVTLCPEQVCPPELGHAHRLHWPLPDPAAWTGSDEERLDVFRRTREEIRHLIEDLESTLPTWEQ